MPRHSDPRLRLTRVSHGYELPARGVVLASGPRFADSCNCELPWCTWSAGKQREAERGYKRRCGTWQSADGRFTLEWIGGGSSLRMWDRVMWVESRHESLRAARTEMDKRYRQEEGEQEQ